MGKPWSKKITFSDEEIIKYLENGGTDNIVCEKLMLLLKHGIDGVHKRNSSITDHEISIIVKFVFQDTGI